ncbi:MAG TPA: hypothetical protein VK995_00430, partial [Oceanipulchritudo sp.]|nr:hypothetical protein [Oceanipulchritudo sp.]
ANVANGWIQLATNLQAGERVHLITEGDSGVYEVLEVKPGQFRTGLQTDKKVVFVYGREVDDFLNVDYEALAMLNVSATQQIKREMEAEIATLRELNQSLIARLERLEAMARDGAANSTPATQSASSGN